MRQIKIKSVIVFISLFSMAGIVAFISAYLIYSIVQNYLLGFILLGIVFLYGYAILAYRIFLKIFVFEEGYIKPDSKLEFIYHVYLLFYLILFYQLIRTKILPVPILKLLYLMLGAKLGKNTYCSGTILDPIFTIAGDNTIIGEDSCLFAHAVEGSHLSHKKIIIGNNVTIGAKSILMSGVTIEDNAIIAAGAVVLKNTEIKKYEVWAGNPAKCIKSSRS